MNFSKIACVNVMGRSISSLMHSNKQVLYNWQRNMVGFNKNIHTGVIPSVWKGKTILTSLLSGQKYTIAGVQVLDRGSAGSIFSSAEQQHRSYLSGIFLNRCIVPWPTEKSEQVAQPPPCSVRFASTDDDIVCYSDLKKLKKAGKVLVIDVRGKDETWRTGTIPGSLCIPFPELESALKMPPEKFEKNYCREKPNSTDEIVFVCRRGERSYKAMKQARIMGYEKSKSYQGGFMSWFDQERIIRERKDKSPNKQ